MKTFLIVFNLRQGTIIIAVHQIALSSCLLIILLVGLSHIGAMLTMLHNDIEYEAGLHSDDLAYGDHSYHGGDVISTNNQRRFATAQKLATITVIFLYSSTILMCLYLMCSISLLYGAIKDKREYVLPWLAAAFVAFILMFLIAMVGSDYRSIYTVFGGSELYHIGFIIFILAYIYSVRTVFNYILEPDPDDSQSTPDTRAASDERGERLLLLDHSAHCSLLSATELNKLNNETCSQLV